MFFFKFIFIFVSIIRPLVTAVHQPRQAASANEKDVWVSEIKKVLMAQFEKLKSELNINTLII